MTTLTDSFKMKVSRFGEDGIRVIFGEGIDLGIHERVRNFYFYIKALQLRAIIDLIPSFRSCLIHFDTELTNFELLSSLLMEREAEALSSGHTPEPVLHQIPVRYGGPEALDMKIVCAQTGLPESEVITIHSNEVYTVFAVGFIPGFPYLGTLDKRIRVPRLETPRTRITAGSVGIAQGQTGVYPFPSPAGWRIIGHTDVHF
ncbi:MAG TPA: allophanate hydrolase subunit 1, partial [Smithellaceae bacterium]|nr:allophanate hydrolase subunit 1 [Smithellaceae bacterium]